MITASIVLYKEDFETLQKTVNSFLKTPIKKQLFLIDNSPTDTLRNYFKNPEIEYIFVGKNSGFGAAHNLVLEKINSEFHLILNPDVTFSTTAIPNLIAQLKTEENLAVIAPKVIYPNGKHQFTCRKYPTIFGLINRKLKFSKKQLFKNQYRDLDLEKPFYPEFIHGCFLLFKTVDFIKLKGFDERYFLYLEDADICKRIDQLGKKKFYFPSEKIFHIHRKGSSKSIKLFFYHLVSAIKYFFKW